MDIDEKKKLQNDILLMSEIGRQYNLYDPKQAKNVLLFMQKRKPLVSVRAESFLARVTLLTEPEAPNECICLLCGKNPAPTGVFCDICSAAIERSVSADAAAAEEEAQSPAEEETYSPAEEEPETTPEPEPEPEPAPDYYDEPVEEIPDKDAEPEPVFEQKNEPEPEPEPEPREEGEPTPDPVAEAASEGVSEESIESDFDAAIAQDLDTIDETPYDGSLDPFDEEPKPKAKPPIALIIATILSLGLLIYVIIFYLLPQHGINLTKPAEPEKEIVTEEAGQDEITADFNEAEYTTEYNETIKVPIGMYDVAVGEYCGDSWNTELIDVMVYHVQSIEDPAKYARLMIAPDGRIIGTGTLVNEEEPLKAYRVK